MYGPLVVFMTLALVDDLTMELGKAGMIITRLHYLLETENDLIATLLREILVREEVLDAVGMLVRAVPMFVWYTA